MLKSLKKQSTFNKTKFLPPSFNQQNPSNRHWWTPCPSLVPDARHQASDLNHQPMFFRMFRLRCLLNAFVWFENTWQNTNKTYIYILYIYIYILIQDSQIPKQNSHQLQLRILEIHRQSLCLQPSKCQLHQHIYTCLCSRIEDRLA